MTMTILSLAEVKSHLSQLVGRVNTQHERVTVTVHGKPSAVLAPEDLEALEETIAILSEPETLGRLASAENELARGEGESEDDLAPSDGCTASEPRVSDARERYTLVIAPAARRQLAQHLPEAVAFAAHEFIVGVLLDNPQRVGKRLQAPLDDLHSARCGTYRVIHRIDDEQMTVTVLDVLTAVTPTGPTADASHRTLLEHSRHPAWVARSADDHHAEPDRMGASRDRQI